VLNHAPIVRSRGICSRVRLYLDVFDLIYFPQSLTFVTIPVIGREDSNAVQSNMSRLIAFPYLWHRLRNADDWFAICDFPLSYLIVLIHWP
jgi:hypothetical protein